MFKIHSDNIEGKYLPSSSADYGLLNYKCDFYLRINVKGTVEVLDYTYFYNTITNKLIHMPRKSIDTSNFT